MSYTTEITYKHPSLNYYKISNQEYPGGQTATQVTPKYNGYYNGLIYMKSFNNGTLTAQLQYCDYTPGVDVNWDNASSINILTLTNNLKAGANLEIDCAEQFQDYESDYIAWRIVLTYTNNATFYQRIFPTEFNPATEQVNSFFVYTPRFLELSIATTENLVPNAIMNECCQNLYVQFLKIEALNNSDLPFTLSRDDPFIFPIYPTNTTEIVQNNKIYERHYFHFDGTKIGETFGTGLTLYKSIGKNQTITQTLTNFKFYSIPQLSQPLYWTPNNILNYLVFSTPLYSYINASFKRSIDEYRWNNISLILKYNNVEKEFALENTSRGDLYTWVGSIDYLFNFNDPIIPSSAWIGRYSLQTYIRIKNDFNETFILGGNAITILDFNKAPEIPRINSVSWASSLDSPTWEILPANKKIVEGIYLKFNTTFRLYSRTLPITKLWLTRGVNPSVLINQYNTYTTDINYATSTAPGITNVELVYGPIQEISTNDIRQWSIENITPVGSALSSKYEMLVAPLTAPSISFLDCDISDNTYNLTYQKNNLNGADKLDLYLVDDNHTNVVGPFDSSTTPLNTTCTSIFTDATWSNVNNFSLRIKAVSAVTSDANAVKRVEKTVFTSPPIRFVRQTPTVAYFPNQLGINTETVNTDAIVDLHSIMDATSSSLNKDKIYIYGINNNNYFKFDTTNGAIIWHDNSGDHQFQR